MPGEQAAGKSESVELNPANANDVAHDSRCSSDSYRRRCELSPVENARSFECRSDCHTLCGIGLG